MKGFIDRRIAQERIKQKLIESQGADFQPPDGWEAFFANDEPIRDMKCLMCGEMVPEVRPFGPNHESICEACAEKDPALSEQRWRELNPDG